MRIVSSKLHISLIGALTSLLLGGCVLFSHEDVPAEPDDNEVPGDCVPGREGCPCSAGGACLGSLQCIDTRCVPPDGCEAGRTGCDCADDETCESSADECVQGLCLPRSACRGELGCACDESGACDEGLRCDAGACRVRNGLTLTFSGGDARACDILLVRDGDRALAEVVFAAGFRGQLRHRGERTAIALVRTLDEPLTGTAATLLFEGNGAAAPALVPTVEATCYDRLGAETSGVTVSVE
jgi:hypothetical protein